MYIYSIIFLIYNIRQVMNSNKKIKFITLSNDGYINYTINCLKSLELINFKEKLNCYVIGENCHNHLRSKGYNSVLLNSVSKGDNRFSVFRTGNWHNITKRKFDIIYSNLLENDYVCFTDGDIVFLDNKFMDFCENFIEDNDIIIQNDSCDDNTDKLCSGFMFIKSTEKTLELFNPKNVAKFVRQNWDDQVYINNIKNNLKFRKLPLQLFPNGGYYYKNFNKIKPMMIHFNWLIGHNKQKMMKKFNYWFL